MVPVPKLAHQPYVPHFLLAHKTYLHSAFHYQLIGQSLYVSKITYDLRARKTQFYHGDRVYGPTAQKILLALQVDSCTPEAMIQLTCFMSTWRPLYVSTLLSNAYITLLTSVGPAIGEKYVKRCCTVTNLKDDMCAGR